MMVSTKWWTAIVFCALIALSGSLTAERPSGATDSSPGPLPSGKMVRYEGNPLLRNGPEDQDYGKTGPRVVLKMGPGDYRMWYEAAGRGGILTVGYATSPDGLTWTKRGVVLPVSQPWEKEEVSPNSVLYEDGIYKLWYHGGGYVRKSKRLGLAQIGYATSKDGLTWVKHQQNPILDVGPAGSFDSQQVAEPRVLHLPDGYRMYFTGQDGAQTSLGMATSQDGIHWTKYPGNPILDKKAWGGFWGGAFFPEKGIWHLWRGSIEPGDPHSASQGAIRSGLRYMWSKDGLTWHEGPNNPVLLQNPDPQAADQGLVGDSVSGYRDGDTYRIMYTGYNSNLFGKFGRFEGICLASIKAASR